MEGEAMGNEQKCRVRFGKQESEGKALLETNEILFRGEFRVKVPFAKIRSAKVVNGDLHLRTAEGEAIFELGTAVAEKWREKILHPKSRIEKLGVKAEARVALMGFGKMDGDFLDELKERTGRVTRDEVQADTEWIFLKVETQKEIAQISRISKKMRGATALWIAFPKKNSKDGLEGVPKITEGDIFTAGRAAGLTDVKVVGFSATHTALKFVIPVAKRVGERA
jgi:hypothetical protein